MKKITVALVNIILGTHVYAQQTLEQRDAKLEKLGNLVIKTSKDKTYYNTRRFYDGDKKYTLTIYDRNENGKFDCQKDGVSIKLDIKSENNYVNAAFFFDSSACDLFNSDKEDKSRIHNNDFFKACVGPDINCAYSL